MGHSDNDAPYFSTSACNASISTTTPLPAALARRRESKYVSLDRDLGKGRDGEKRRGQFLEKVKRRGEEKRFESREEHALRLEHLTRKKEWEKEQERLGEEMGARLEEEEELLDEWQQSGRQVEDMDEDGLIEEFLSQEDLEMEAIASMYDGPGYGTDNGNGGGNQGKEMTEYGSDDEEYERLLVESVLAAEQGRGEGGGQGDLRLQEDQDTDMVLD